MGKSLCNEYSDGESERVVTADGNTAASRLSRLFESADDSSGEMSGVGGRILSVPRSSSTHIDVRGSDVPPRPQSVPQQQMPASRSRNSRKKRASASYWKEKAKTYKARVAVLEAENASMKLRIKELDDTVRILQTQMELSNVSVGDGAFSPAASHRRRQSSVVSWGRERCRIEQR